VQDAIVQGIENAQQKNRHNPFSESLWLELFEKLVEMHNNTKQDKPNMYYVLTQYLAPDNEYVKAAYALFNRLNSKPKSPPHFHVAKMCAIHTLALLLVQPLRKNGITSNVEYTRPESQKELLKLLNGDEGQNSVPLKQQTKRGLLSLIDDQEPCSSLFDRDPKNISCSQVLVEHTDWHKSPQPWSGDYGEWSVFWQALVDVSSKIYKVSTKADWRPPTYWRGSHSRQHDKEYFEREFLDFFHNRALKGNFLQLHEEILSIALKECTHDQRHRLQNPAVSNVLPDKSTEETFYCFLCITRMASSIFDYYSNYRVFQCYHRFCETCVAFAKSKCPICGMGKIKN